MDNIYLTKNINEKLVLKILSGIIILLRRKVFNKKGITNSFHSFEVRKNKLIHKEGQTQNNEEYDLVGEFEETKVWAVQGKRFRI